MFGARLGRFERKILWAMAALAGASLLASFFVGRAALYEAYRVGANPQVEEGLKLALAVHREYLVDLKKRAQLTADAVQWHSGFKHAVEVQEKVLLQTAIHSLLDRYDSLAEVEVLDPHGKLLVKETRSSFAEPVRLLRVNRTQPSARGKVQLGITVATPQRLFSSYQRAGELVETFEHLERGAQKISSYYFGVYMAFVGIVIVLAFTISAKVSRRVTRRVALLAEATAKVGRGDLHVQVPTDGTDEVGELTRAFNAMVFDLRESRERIDYLQKISAWQEFARRLAHEIKNPLTPIQLAAQQVHRVYKREDPEFSRVLDEMKNVIEEEVGVLRRLVGEFSAFAKLPEARLAKADLGDFVRETNWTLSLDLEKLPPNEVPQFETRLEPGSLPVFLDAMMFKRCVDNLIQNAHAALRASKKEKKLIVLEVSRRDRFVLLEIRDNGAGIDARVRQTLFNPYVTTKAEGTGLGLAIVKKIVLEHRGEIEVFDAPEGGAGFRIQVPLTA